MVKCDEVVVGGSHRQGQECFKVRRSSGKCTNCSFQDCNAIFWMSDPGRIAAARSPSCNGPQCVKANFA